MKIDWKKAPKIKKCILIGHSFDKSGKGGWWHYLRLGRDYLLETSEYHMDFIKPIGLDWKTSFTPAPRSRK